MSRRRNVWLVLLSCTAIMLVTPVSGTELARHELPLTASRSIVVSTVAELEAALGAGTDLHIFIQRGTYLLSHTIAVPDNTVLVGEGLMQYDESGLPTGFAPESRTVIGAMSGITGDFVTLGDGAALHDLVIQDVIRPGTTGGAVVAVSSRLPGDSVSAQIIECDVFNPNGLGRTPAGPSGRGLVVMSRNPHLTSGDVPHEQSSVSAVLAHSIIRSPAGGIGVFGTNFAANSRVRLHLRRNVVGGGLDVVGGASRPDSVVGSTTSVESIENLYHPDSATHSSAGWNLTGGSDAPFPGLIAENTDNNATLVLSVGDRIEGFTLAIQALGAQRFSALAANSSSNQLELVLEGTQFASAKSDLLFFGANSNIATMPAGDGNELRVTMRNVIGSGPRTNTYIDAVLGVGNRLIFHGSANAFSHTNQNILPAPGDEFFTATDGGQSTKLGPIRFVIRK